MHHHKRMQSSRTDNPGRMEKVQSDTNTEQEYKEQHMSLGCNEIKLFVSEIFVYEIPIDTVQSMRTLLEIERQFPVYNPNKPRMCRFLSCRRVPMQDNTMKMVIQWQLTKNH